MNSFQRAWRSTLRRPVRSALLLLADESTGNLDEATAWDVTELLKRIAHEQGKCVIVVTHSRELAQAADELIQIGK